MYEKFFGFTEPPFNQTPDPQFFCPSPTHEEAFSLILHGITCRKGFIVITGEVGTGKTTLSRRLLETLDPSVKAALILNPGSNPIELLQSVNQGFGVGSKNLSKMELVVELNRFLLDNLKAGNNAVLVIDEAQNLTVECLEEIRLLSNLETPKVKLLQIVLLGQPELERTLRLTELRQLAQRIVLRNHLRPLDFEETRVYIASRLAVAGRKDQDLFSASAVERVHALSGGVPRVINALCDKALLAACVREYKLIGDALINEVGRDLAGFSAPMEQALQLSSARLPSRVDSAATVRRSSSGGVAAAQQRPRVRVTPGWVGLAGLLVAGFFGALYWLGPTWFKVNEFMSGAGKVPPPLTATPAPAPSAGSAQAIPAPPAPAPPVPAGANPSAPVAGPPEPPVQAISFNDLKEVRLAATVSLLNRWGRFQSVPFDRLVGRDPGSLVREAGLQSAALPLDLGLLERLDYPCLLEWKDAPESARHAVVLVGLGPTEATILDPLAGRRVVGREELAKHVVGEALIFWKTLPGIKIPLKIKKEKDPSVMEVQRLLKKEGLYAGNANGFYNPATRAAIALLQSKARLKETGDFGVQSYMTLSKRVLGATVPSLKAEP
jgi:general secretion pathway protein A